MSTFIISKTQLTYNEPIATAFAALLTPVLREILCIHSDDVKAHHGDHGEKTKRIGEIVKSLMRNHRELCSKYKSQKRVSSSTRFEENIWPFSKIVIAERERGLFVHYLFSTGQHGFAHWHRTTSFPQPNPSHTFVAMRPTISRQSDMPGRKFS